MMIDVSLLPDFRGKLMPDALCYVQTFEASTDKGALEGVIKQWVDDTGNLIVAVGPVLLHENNKKQVAVLYVPAVEGNESNYDSQQRQATQVIGGIITSDRPPEHYRGPIQQAATAITEALLSDGVNYWR